MATVYFSGYVFRDNGTALSGATVALLEAGTTTEEASTTTDFAIHIEPPVLLR